MPGDRPVIELTYYETYYFANAVKNVLEHQMHYLRNLDDFYGDMKYVGLVRPFHKYSAFHAFIEFVIDEIMSDEVLYDKLDIRQDTFDRLKEVPSAWVLDPHPAKLSVNLALDRYGIQHQGFQEWLQEHGTTFVDARKADLEEYCYLLREDGTWDQLLERATREVFFVLFQNRHVLMLFNDMIADQVKQYGADAMSSEHAEFTGIVNIWTADNYDHIVPLASGGLNDASNIQLLCRECNSRKRAADAGTSNRYEAWYPDEG